MDPCFSAFKLSRVQALLTCRSCHQMLLTWDNSLVCVSVPDDMGIWSSMC